MANFTLTGTFVHTNDGVTPIVDSPIQIKADPFPLSTTVQTGKQSVRTDEDGKISVTLTTSVTGLYYVIRSMAKTALFQPIRFLAPTAGSTLDVSSLIFYNPGPAPSETVIAAALAAAQAAVASVAYSTWQATTAYVSGQTVQAPDGSLIKANSSRTSRASFDATEQTFWTLVSAKAGTLQQVGLASAFPARSVPTQDAPAFGLYYPEAHGTVGAGTDSAAIQASIAAARAAGGGKVLLTRAAGYTLDAAITIPSRVRVEGLSSSGDIPVKAANGLNTSMFYVGATDGTDPNWHWGDIGYVYIDGNKANQTRPAAKTITVATTSGYVGTITTSTAHGLVVGDFTEITGVTPAGYNGRWRVESVTSTTVFTIQHLTNAMGAGTVFGTSRELLNGINVGKGGEASSIHNVYVTGCLNSGIAQGTTGTPMAYRNVSSFSNGDYGFDLWCDRPIILDTPSGDLNGLGLIHAAGTSSAGGSGTDSSITILNPKAEHHIVPVVKLNDFDGPVTVIGGSIDMETTNTGPVFQRTSASLNSSLFVIGTRINPRASGTVIFQDLTSAARNVTTTSATAETWTFEINKQPHGLLRYSQFRNDLTDSSTVSPNLQNGTICKWTIGGTPRTVGIPTNRPVGSPNAERLVIDMKNNTGGAIAITWDAIFVMATWVNPAAGKRKTIEFYWDGTNFVQVGTPSADM